MKHLFLAWFLLSVLAHKTIVDDEEDGEIPTETWATESTNDLVPEEDPNDAFNIPGEDGAAKKAGPMDKIKAFFSHEPQWYWDHCRYELIFLLFMLIEIVWLQNGKRTNS